MQNNLTSSFNQIITSEIEKLNLTDNSLSYLILNNVCKKDYDFIQFTELSHSLFKTFCSTIINKKSVETDLQEIFKNQESIVKNQLIKILLSKKLNHILPIGKYKGQNIFDINDFYYLDWMSRVVEDHKIIAQTAKNILKINEIFSKNLIKN